MKDTQILTKLMFVASDSFHFQCICLLFYTIIFDVFLYDKFSIPVAVLSLFSLYFVEECIFDLRPTNLITGTPEVLSLNFLITFLLVLLKHVEFSG